jgi:hypothetical protein
MPLSGPRAETDVTETGSTGATACQRSIVHAAPPARSHHCRSALGPSPSEARPGTDGLTISESSSFLSHRTRRLHEFIAASFVTNGENTANNENSAVFQPKTTSQSDARKYLCKARHGPMLRTVLLVRIGGGSAAAAMRVAINEPNGATLRPNSVSRGQANGPAPTLCEGYRSQLVQLCVLQHARLDVLIERERAALRLLCQVRRLEARHRYLLARRIHPSGPGDGHGDADRSGAAGHWTAVPTESARQGRCAQRCLRACLCVCARACVGGDACCIVMFLIPKCCMSGMLSSVIP